MPESPAKFYLTTPIYYVNARPHIGHAYTTIVADVLARRHRLLGHDTWFLTGTDEHGQKIERSAKAAGIPPQQFTDQVSAEFRRLWDRMGLTYDQYIRTTDEAHKRGVQKLFRELQERGHIYLSSYTGQYCVSEEIFVEGPPGTIGPDGRPTETVTEENYFFRLSAFQRPLIDLIESNQLEVQPEARKNELLSFLRGPANQHLNLAPQQTSVILSEAQSAESKDPEAAHAATSSGKLSGTIAYSNAGTPYVEGALRDLSISRSSFTWGIPVPGDEKHVIYVWLDALANYMTALGYSDDSPEAQAKFARYWPADLHLVGKEIIRQHCIYWPAFLMAAGLPLPRKVVAHGWLLFEESKMSKSKGNIVRAETILDAFGERVYKAQFPDSTKHEQDLFAADVLRYFLLREIPFGQDGSFSFDAMITRYNADLANGYGNLVSRTLNMISQNFNGEIPGASSELFPIGSNLVGQQFGQGPVDLTRNLSEIAGFVAALDGYLSEKAPWKLAKMTDQASRSDLAQILYNSAETLRLLTLLLAPILPTTAANVWRQLGLGDINEAAKRGELTNLQWGGLKPGTRLGPLTPIFPRADKGLAQIMADMELNKSAAAPLPSADRSEASGPETTAPTDPAAGPRTSTLAEPNPGAHVGGSASPTAVLPPVPSHTEAAASGIFAGSQEAAHPTDASPQITIDDFAKVELRVARVLVCERIPKADKLLRLEVDLGHEKRQILSGIAEWYTPEDLIGRRIVVITNLAPRKMRGLDSHGMLLAASSEGGKPALATFADSDELPLGARLK